MQCYRKNIKFGSLLECIEINQEMVTSQSITYIKRRFQDPKCIIMFFYGDPI